MRERHERLRSRHFLPPALALALALCAVPGARADDDSFIARHQDAWGRFGKASWKRVRVLTETFDEQGNLDSTTTTETTTSLHGVSDRAITLRSEITVEVAGKRFNAQPQEVTQGFGGASNGQQVSIKNVGPGTVVICGQKIPSQIREVTTLGEKGQSVSTIHYSDLVSPYVLKRETKGTALDGDANKYQTIVEVLAIDMPYKVLTETRSCAYVRTIHTNPRGKTVTLEVHCADVPGAIVAHTSKQTDASGRLVRRSTLELLDYDAREPEVTGVQVQRRFLFRRKRPRTLRN